MKKSLEVYWPLLAIVAGAAAAIVCSLLLFGLLWTGLAVGLVAVLMGAAELR